MTKNPKNFDIATFQSSLFEAIERQESEEVERIMSEVVRLARRDNLSGNDVIDILAAHDILPGKGFHEWVMMEYKLQELQDKLKEQEACSTSQSAH